MDPAAHELLEEQILSTFHRHASENTSLVARLVCDHIRGPDYWRAVCLLKVRINLVRDTAPQEFTRAGARALLMGSVGVVGVNMISASQFMRLQAVGAYYAAGLVNQGPNGTIREGEVDANVFQNALKDDVLYEMTRMLHKI